MAIVTIDSNPPESSVSALPPVETNASFAVCWFGTFVGAAIVSYDVYASTNSGPWGIWLQQTTNSCAEFQGEPGGSYSFYSIAHDGAGLVQTNGGVAQASTTVVGSPTQISIRLAADHAILGWSANAGNFTLQTATNLAPPVTWTSATNAVSVIGSSNTAVGPITNTVQFFRLKSQP